METLATTRGEQPKYSLSPATEADLPRLVDIQFKTYSFFGPEVLANGKDTPENQAAVLARHQEALRTESGTRIVKVELTDNSNSSQENEAESAAGNIIAFCIFCLPNEDASTPEGRIPMAVRPKKTPLEANFIKNDPIRRARVEKSMNSSYHSIQAAVAGRKCAWMRYMSVLPAYQRRGIGKLIMDWGCRLFDEHGVDACLRASAGGEGLYLQYGFEPIGTTFDEDDADGVTCTIMWRKAGAKKQSKPSTTTK